VRTPLALAAHISDVPHCTLLRFSRTQVKPAPLTLAVWGEPAGPSYPTKATNKSPGVVVENTGVCMVPLPSTETVTSLPITFGGWELSTVTVTGAE